MINNTYQDMKPNSIAFFQNLSLIIIDKESYHTIPISQLSADIPPTNITSLPVPQNDIISGSSKFDSGVAGGFTVLGMFIGVVLVFLIRYIWKRHRSDKEPPSRSMKNSSRDCKYLSTIFFF